MPAIIDPPPTADAPARPLRVKLGWFAALAFGGAGATAALAYLLRWLLRI